MMAQFDKAFIVNMLGFSKDGFQVHIAMEAVGGDEQPTDEEAKFHTLQVSSAFVIHRDLQRVDFNKDDHKVFPVTELRDDHDNDHEHDYNQHQPPKQQDANSNEG